MYRFKDRKTIALFSELFPFGGQLDPDNRWLKIAKLIPWGKLELKYQSYFSDKGRPAKDGRLVIGIILLKHMNKLSDEEMVKQVNENPYMQAFCGLDKFVTTHLLDPSCLSKVRKRLGKKYFKELERETYHILIELKIIKGKGMLADATVFPEYIRYPTDTGLLNEAREWVVKNIKKFGKSLGIKVRTYCRKAHKEYLNFSKKKRKSKKLIRRTNKSLLQYVRRNIKQMGFLLEEANQHGIKIEQKVLERFDVVCKVYEQQLQMYRQKVNRIKNRIVSLHRHWTRPIVRGKSGDKTVEFGPKASLFYVDGFVFLEHLSSENFSEANRLENLIGQYENLFGKKPDYVVGDKLYGNRDNRKFIKELNIRDALEPLGRRDRKQDSSDRWRKQKQRERNRIEGIFGHAKNHFGLDKIKYYTQEGPEIWVRMSLLSMNLKTAEKRI